MDSSGINNINIYNLYDRSLKDIKDISFLIKSALFDGYTIKKSDKRPDGQLNTYEKEILRAYKTKIDNIDKQNDKIINTVNELSDKKEQCEKINKYLKDIEEGYYMDDIIIPPASLTRAKIYLEQKKCGILSGISNLFKK